MARQTVALSAIKIKSAKAKNKKYKLSDGGGLFLLVNPNGSKLWRLKYRYNNKEKEYAIVLTDQFNMSNKYNNIDIFFYYVEIMNKCRHIIW